jgi:diacylglycerol kinase (ATP)
MSRTAIILNRAAGGGKCAKQAGPALAKLREAIPELEVHWTDYAGHATELARIARREGVETLIAAGGDGTVYEVINGIFPGEGSCRLGILPLGTGNSFLRDFGITDAQAALATIIKGESQPVDVIRATHSDGELHYINLLSLGFSAEAGALTNRRFKGFGLGGYAMAVVMSLLRLGHPHFTYTPAEATKRDGPCTLLSFSNSRYTGGTMMMAPEAQVDDGLLDIIHIGPLSRGRLLRCFPKIYQGTHVDLEEIDQGRSRRVDFFDMPKTDVMIDGEILQIALESLEVLPKAIEVLR